MLRVSCYGVRVTGYELKIWSYGFRIKSYGLRVQELRVTGTYFLLHTTYFFSLAQYLFFPKQQAISMIYPEEISGQPGLKSLALFFVLSCILHPVSCILFLVFLLPTPYFFTLRPPLSALRSLPTSYFLLLPSSYSPTQLLNFFPQTV